jgi:YHS domain-containing protein
MAGEELSAWRERERPRSTHPHDCGTCRERASGAWDISLGGRISHFCSKVCLMKFLNPEGEYEAKKKKKK